MKKVFSLSLLIAALVMIGFASCKPTEPTNVAVTGVTVSPTTLELEVGKTSKITATVTPNNATNKKVTWASSSPTVATVDASGTVTGVAAGTANITVTTEDGKKTNTCAVTVKANSGGSGDEYPADNYKYEPNQATSIKTTIVEGKITDYGDLFKVGTKNLFVVATINKKELLLADFFVDLNSTIFTPGTYNVSKTKAVGTMLWSPGVTDPQKKLYEFSSFYGELNDKNEVTKIFFIVGGTATVTANEIKVSAKSYFGSSIDITYTGDMTLHQPSQGGGVPAYLKSQDGVRL